jgi:hypothetical protein
LCIVVETRVASLARVIACAVPFFFFFMQKAAYELE